MMLSIESIFLNELRKLRDSLPQRIDFLLEFLFKLLILFLKNLDTLFTLFKFSWAITLRVDLNLVEFLTDLCDSIAVWWLCYWEGTRKTKTSIVKIILNMTKFILTSVRHFPYYFIFCLSVSFFICFSLYLFYYFLWGLELNIWFINIFIAFTVIKATLFRNCVK